MLDGVVIANEIVREVKDKRNSCFIYKVDFEKASELVRLDFLNYMLHRIGLCDKWIRWIKFCLSYASILVLVNGSPTEEYPF